MNVLEVKDLNKKYEKFQLKNVTFHVEEGKICGFIGRNGAGKTTTLKSLLNQVHPDSGSIQFFNKDFVENELLIKKQIGFVSGGISFYPKKTLKALTKVTKTFYENWDEEAYKRFMTLFSLDEDKKADQLSEGMKVKYLLTLAMSHKAKFLILDEPTSGLDPVSRDELLDIFIDLVEKEGVTILFSTHITSDLDKCADCITYIKNGEIMSCEDMKSFIGKYKKIKGSEEILTEEYEQKLIGLRKHAGEFQAIVESKDVPAFEAIQDVTINDALLEDIMIHMEKE